MNRSNSDAEGSAAELEEAGFVWSALHAVKSLTVIACVGMEKLRNGTRFHRFALPVFSGLGLLSAACAAQAQGTGLQAQIPAAEYNALVDLYNAANGPNWISHSGWTNPQAQSWYGVTVVGGHVTQLDLGWNMLSGNIPDSLADLSRLQALDLSFNIELGGDIPASLGSLTQLRDLNLANNRLTGNIPDSLGNLSQLHSLGLSGNQLFGNIPASLGNLTELSDLGLVANQLTGNIPGSLGNLSQLHSLSLQQNQLTGDIPDSLGNLSQLQSLELSDNQLSGNIPNNLGNLHQLTLLWLSRNQLSGSIPVSLGGLSQLQYFYLSDNRLTGSIPDSLGDLPQLQVLDLGYNRLSGSIPNNLGNLHQLTDLRLSANQLSGGIPVSLGNLSWLQFLDLDSNQLSGGIPVNLGNCSRMRMLDLDSNQLSGTIPNFSAYSGAIINVSYNYLGVAEGSQSLFNVNAMVAAGNNVIYLPQSGTDPPTGFLQVTITPSAAVNAGAQWQVDGGAFQDSGTTVAGLWVGNHTLSFSTVSDWTTPADQTVVISDGTTTTATGIYAPPFIYTTNNDTLTLAGSSCGQSVVCIPTTINTLPVTGIGAGAFSNCTNLLMVTIPSSVAFIGASAFSGCVRLESVLFQGNAPAADLSAFSGDTNAVVYYLPNRTGWGSMFGGVSTLLWNPAACTPAVQDNQFGFGILGTTNIPVAVETCTNLACSTWVTAQAGILTNGFLQSRDPLWTNHPSCFYRLCFPQPTGSHAP